MIPGRLPRSPRSDSRDVAWARLSGLTKFSVGATLGLLGMAASLVIAFVLSLAAELAVGIEDTGVVVLLLFAGAALTGGMAILWACR